MIITWRTALRRALVVAAVPPAIAIWMGADSVDVLAAFRLSGLAAALVAWATKIEASDLEDTAYQLVRIYALAVSYFVIFTLEIAAIFTGVGA